MADTEKPAEKSSDAGSSAKKQRKDRQAGKKVVAGANAVRSRIASVVWLVAVVCALILAVGALLIALHANQDNAIVKFVLDAADRLDLDVFSRKEGIFTFTGENAATKNALVNWGIAAIAYLIVGKVLDRIIRP